MSNKDSDISKEDRVAAILEKTAGMWKGRNDIPADGVEYVNQLRRRNRLNDLELIASQYNDEEWAELQRELDTIAALNDPEPPNDNLTAKAYKKILYGPQNGENDVL